MITNPFHTIADFLLLINRLDDINTKRKKNFKFFGRSFEKEMIARLESLSLLIYFSAIATTIFSK